MTRRLIPGGVDRHGIAHPLPHCTGFCRGGRAPCNCATGHVDCELANDVPPDDKRVIQPPPAPLKPNHRASAARWALAIAVALYLVLVGLLKLAGARSFGQ